MKLIEAMHAGLRAVNEGRVRHVFSGNGNVYKCDGISSLTFRRLDRHGLIVDGPSSGAHYSRACPVHLTPAGRAALEQEGGRTNER